MANNWYLVSALTGGADGALDALDGAALADGARAIAIVGDLAAFYVMDIDSAEDSDPPNTIPPVTNAGDKRWKLRKAIPYSVWEAMTSDSPYVAPIVSGSTRSMCVGDDCKIVDSDSVMINHGESNSISNCMWAIIAGGEYNEIWDGGDHFLSGSGNEIFHSNNWSSTICGGFSHAAWGNTSTLVGGGKNKSLAEFGGMVGGYRGLSYIDYQDVCAVDRFDANGDAQRSTIIRKVESTGAAAVTFGDELIPIGNRTWKFSIDIAARQTGGTGGTVGDSAFWAITGGIKTTGGVNAQGTITFTDIPVVSEIFTIGSDVFTFTSEDNLLKSHDVTLSAFKPVSGVEAAIERSLPWVSVVSSFTPGTVILTSLYTRASDNSIVFTEAATNTTMDGSGTFGGTVAGVDPTTALVGTPQGAGVPAATDRDTAAAAWSIAVTADNTGNFLKIEATGEVDKTIHWVAKIGLVEVG